MIDQKLLFRICTNAIHSTGATSRVAPVIDERNAVPVVNSCVAVYNLQSEEPVESFGGRAVFRTWQIELRTLTYDLMNLVDRELVSELKTEQRVVTIGSAFDVAEDDTTTKTIYRRQRTVDLEPE